MLVFGRDPPDGSAERAERAGAVVTDVAGGPWWQATVRGPRANVVAAPKSQHAALLELLRSLKTTVRTRR